MYVRIEFVLNCYQSQLEEKEKSHQDEIDKLKDEMDSLRKQKQEKREELSVKCDPVSPVTAAECSSLTPVLVKSSSPLLERGDGEVCAYTDFSELSVWGGECIYLCNAFYYRLYVWLFYCLY